MKLCYADVQYDYQSNRKETNILRGRKKILDNLIRSSKIKPPHGGDMESPMLQKTGILVSGGQGYTGLSI